MAARAVLSGAAASRRLQHGVLQGAPTALMLHTHALFRRCLRRQLSLMAAPAQPHGGASSASWRRQLSLMAAPAQPHGGAASCQHCVRLPSPPSRRLPHRPSVLSPADPGASAALFRFAAPPHMLPARVAHPPRDVRMGVCAVAQGLLRAMDRGRLLQGVSLALWHPLGGYYILIQTRRFSATPHSNQPTSRSHALGLRCVARAQHHAAGGSKG